ncbi:thiamine-phosphate pyrophosphorylase [Helicobacter apodemus]|uniref:Thiamine-phosphate pyrophosphorylase n=1 Tax=Helicobacter apodemus TaxID=135569 RepID=A0A2U8FF14_9HELI|nr:thiamine-phosphate pyrophosphorylase [Helicobacter apodemus]AWI34015.1 thiamine-phosphate pyrophosphorylase [Helicobacter apodemus]
MNLEDSTFRILDANLNRLREGIRVIEDMLRYVFNNKNLALKLKKLRHQCKVSLKENPLLARDSQNDILKLTTQEEMQRTNLQDIMIANFKRTQESSRVLEEILKLYDLEKSQKFKNIRYELYTLEKEILIATIAK